MINLQHNAAKYQDMTAVSVADDATHVNYDCATDEIRNRASKLDCLSHAVFVSNIFKRCQTDAERQVGECLFYSRTAVNVHSLSCFYGRPA